MNNQHQKFGQLPIDQTKIDRLLKLLDFSLIGGANVGLSALPIIKRASGAGLAWALPSTGCDNTDFYLGCEIAVAWLCSIYAGAPESDLAEPQVIGDLHVIHEALSRVSSTDEYALGFLSTLEGFIDRALNYPNRHAKTLNRLHELARMPDMLRERCKLVLLEGCTPPDVLR
jgi:hypothetical protein